MVQGAASMPPTYSYARKLAHSISNCLRNSLTRKGLSRITTFSWFPITAWAQQTRWVISSVWHVKVPLFNGMHGHLAVKRTSMVVWMMDSSALARGRGDKCESRRTRLKRSMIRRTRKMEDNGASMQLLYLSSPIERTRNKQPSINDAELVMHVCLGMVKLSRWRRHIPYINISLQCTSFMQGSIQHFIGSFRPNKIYMGGDV